MLNITQNAEDLNNLEKLRGILAILFNIVQDDVDLVYNYLEYLTSI